MNPETDAAFSGERIKLTPGERFRQIVMVVGIVLLVIVGASSWYVWHWQQTQPVTVISHGLEETQVPTKNFLVGQLYFSAIRSDDDTAAPYIYKKDFTDDYINRAFDFSALSYAYSNTQYDTMVTYINESVDPDGLQLIWRDRQTGETGTLPRLTGYSEMELTVSPDNIYYAYSYLETAAKNPSQLTDWDIVLINSDTLKITVVNGAMEPHFTANGKYLYYMKTDGIYRYDIETETHTLVSNIYQDLTPIDDYTISDNGNVLVFTSPSLRTISIQELDAEGHSTEVGAEVGVAVRYRQPMMSPDGETYIVMVARDNDFDTTTQTYHTVFGEIRSLYGKTVLDTVPFTGFVPGSVQLNEWRDDIQN